MAWWPGRTATSYGGGGSSFAGGCAFSCNSFVCGCECECECECGCGCGCGCGCAVALNSFTTEVLPPATMEIYISHCTITSSQLSRATLSDAGVKYRGLSLSRPFVESRSI